MIKKKIRLASKQLQFTSLTGTLNIIFNNSIESKYWKYLKAVGKLVFVLLGIHAFIFHFGHYGVLIKISWIKFKLEVFIAKLWLTSYDAYRLSTEILPNIIESTLYLIFIYYCNANILKINMMHSDTLLFALNKNSKTSSNLKRDMVFQG